MIRFAINLAVSVLVIVGATWLAKRKPDLAGFVAALPITTMLVLLLSHLDHVSMTQQSRFAKSLLIGVPLSLSFLIPFILAPRLSLGFWSSFALGLVLLAGGYAVHRLLVGHS